MGAGTVISAGVAIDNSIIGEDVEIGQGAQITRSFIASGSKVEADSELFDRYISATEDLPIIF